jgi:hypothetical protein
MMKRTAIFLIVMMLTVVWVVPVNAVTWSQSEAAITWLKGQQEADGGFSSGFSDGSDYGATVEVILAAVAAGQDVSQWVSAEGASPLDYVAAQVASGQVTDAGAISKAVFVAVATGQDPRNFGGTDLVAGLQAMQDAGTGMYGSTLFAHAYAMLALHNAGVPISEPAVGVLTSQVTEDGGWALFGGTTPGTADTNTTALAMQALIAAGRPGAAAGAEAYLRRMQNDDGGFPYQKPSRWGTETDANSTAVVVQALNALGEPMSAWAAGGTDPLGALLALWDEASGAYLWKSEVPSANMLATAQAVQAAEGMTLVDLDVVGASRPPSEVDVTAPLLPESGAAPGGQIILAGLLLVTAGWVLRKRRGETLAA